MNWKLETKNISDVKPYGNNPRRITEKGMKDLKKSIGKFGLAEPIVINTDGTIIGGHARYLALKEKGVKEFDCYIPDRELTEDELKELNVRLNKNIAGEFDFDILANEFELDMLLDIGFTEFELGKGEIFNPVGIEEQGKLDQKEPKFVVCPHCGKEFNINE